MHDSASRRCRWLLRRRQTFATRSTFPFPVGFSTVAVIVAAVKTSDSTLSTFVSDAIVACRNDIGRSTLFARQDQESGRSQDNQCGPATGRNADV